MERTVYKWTVRVIFAPDDPKNKEEVKYKESYERWKSQVLRSVSTATEADFNDRNTTFYKVLNEPKDIYDYIICANPVPCDDILDQAVVIFKRQKMITNKTGSVMKEVNKHEKI